MKVLHIINNLGAGGAEHLLVKALPLFKNFNIAVDVLQLSRVATVSKYLEVLQQEQIKVFDLGFSNVYNPSLIVKLNKFLQENEYDIIHVHLFPSMYWAAMSLWGKRKKNKKIVFTEHTSWNTRVKFPFFRFTDKLIYKQYDAIIGISGLIEARLKDLSLELKTRVILNGVDIAGIAKAPVYAREVLKKKFTLPDDEINVLLMAARFTYPKDHMTVIKALAILPDNIHMLFAGEGDEKSKAIQLAINLGIQKRVHFIGFREDILSIMKSVDINLLSSEYEGMSGVGLESLASGRPFLGTDVTGINSIVPDERFLFPFGDEHELAKKIQVLIRDSSLQKDMIKDGIDVALKHDLSKMVGEYCSLYLELVKTIKI